MKQRRFIAWMLMIVSMVMLTASVLPHHHHQEILCLQHDVEACECASHCEGKHHDHYHHEGHCSHGKHACGSDCVTHFQTITPDDASVEVSPEYSFCSLLYTVSDILSIPLPLSEKKANLSYFYLEKLHSTGVLPVMGLRAPPFVLAWLDGVTTGYIICLYIWTITIKSHKTSWRKFSLWESWGCFS